MGALSQTTSSTAQERLFLMVFGRLAGRLSNSIKTVTTVFALNCMSMRTGQGKAPRKEPCSRRTRPSSSPSNVNG